MNNKNNSGDCNSGSWNSGSYNSGRCNSGSYNSGHNNSGNYNSGHYNSGDCNSGWHNSGNCNSGHNNSGNWNSGTWNSGYYNSGGCNSGDCNSGNYNSGNWNSGRYNSGNWNSGFFNTDNPTVRCFNKETGIKMEDFKFPNINGFKLTEYVNGKLVTYEYKEAWKIFWNSISEDRKSEFLNLPNFDSQIFEEITGIKIEPAINKQSLINKINRIQYLQELKTRIDNDISKELNIINSHHYEALKLEIL